MKYKVGDRTLLGEIAKVNDGMSIPYRVEAGDCRWFTESEIDAIIVKPKRNIDHLIELIEARKREEAVAFIDYDHSRNAPWANLNALLYPYTEPSRYPKLTPEELRAVKWLVEGGFTQLKSLNGISEIAESEEAYLHLTSFMPVVKCLRYAKWITTEPINLSELIAAQEAL